MPIPRKPLATFRAAVNERGERLRKLKFEELKRLAMPTEYLTIESRPATIDVIVQPSPTGGGIRVVIQGFLKAKLIGKDVALDGFYKYPDETITPMTREEFYEFD